MTSFSGRENMLSRVQRARPCTGARLSRKPSRAHSNLQVDPSGLAMAESHLLPTPNGPNVLGLFRV